MSEKWEIRWVSLSARIRRDAEIRGLAQIETYAVRMSGVMASIWNKSLVAVGQR